MIGEENIEILIGKVLNGSATSDEQEIVAAWRDESADNETLFLDFKRVWKLEEPLYRKIDVPKAKTIVYGKILDRLGKEPKHVFSQYWRRIAAILFIPLMIGTVWRFLDSSSQKEEIVFQMVSPNRHRSQCTLPDGTEVWLNSNTKITFRMREGDDARRVDLDGEAYFKVAKYASSPFWVQTKSIDVKVFGTCFNVSSYSEDPNSMVTLEEGSVGVFKKNASKEVVMLEPGEQACFDPQGHLTSKKEVDTYATVAWKEGEFVFKDQNLGVIAKELERIYDVKIHFSSKELAAYHFRGVIQFDNTLFHALSILELTSDIAYRIEGRDIYFSSKKKKI